MSRRIDEYENPADSCRAIVSFMEALPRETEHYQDVVKLLLGDLCWKVRQVEPMERAILLAEAWQNALPKELAQQYTREFLKFRDFEGLRRTKKEAVDVGIITVVPTELDAVLIALGRQPSDAPDQVSGEFSYWFGKVERHAGRRASVVVLSVAQAGNVACAIAVERLLGDFEVGLLMLVGIAAGVEEKVKLGDVVWATKVYDYEHVRLEVATLLGFHIPFIRRQRPRPKLFDIEQHVRTALTRLGAQTFQTEFAELASKVDEKELPEGFERIPELHDGTIAAGEKLIADGKLKRMYDEVDQELRAGAMEDSGFAQAARMKQVPWCIFRGISDYANPYKEKGWQFVAALAAAAAGTSFIKSVWRQERRVVPGIGSRGRA